VRDREIGQPINSEEGSETEFALGLRYEHSSDRVRWRVPSTVSFADFLPYKLVTLMRTMRLADNCHHRFKRWFVVSAKWHEPDILLRVSRIKAASGVRRGKAALFQWVQVPPGHRSSRKQPEQSWR